MNPHFFTAPFYFAFIWFRVQGSRFRALVAASPPFLEDGILVSQPSPRGEGAPKGRIGQGRYEREREMRIKQGGWQRPSAGFVNGDARKQYSSHQSLAVSLATSPRTPAPLFICS